MNYSYKEYQNVQRTILIHNNFQFELGRTQTTLPLSAAVMVNSGKHIVPQFPQRLKVIPKVDFLLFADLFIEKHIVPQFTQRLKRSFRLTFLLFALITFVSSVRSSSCNSATLLVQWLAFEFSLSSMPQCNCSCS